MLKKYGRSPLGNILLTGEGLDWGNSAIERVIRSGKILGKYGLLRIKVRYWGAGKKFLAQEGEKDSARREQENILGLSSLEGRGGEWATEKANWITQWIRKEGTGPSSREERPQKPSLGFKSGGKEQQVNLNKAWRGMGGGTGC